MISPVNKSPKRFVAIGRVCGDVLICIMLVLMFAATAYGGGDKVILTAAERAWLTKNQSRLVLAVETGYAPFVFLDAQEQPAGLAHDYLRLIEAKLGVQFRQKRYASLDEIFQAVRSGEVHIVNAVTSTPARAKFLSMTEPYVSVPNVIIVSKTRSGPMPEYELAGLRVALVKSYAITEHMTNRGLHFASDLVPDDLTALLNVSFGRSDAAVIDLATASYLISEKGITNLRVAGEVAYDIRLSIGTPLNEPILHGILQKGLDAITETERLEIKNRWINATQNQNIFRERQFWVVLGSMLAVTLAVFVVILAWNRTLRRQVAIRTEALLAEQEALRESQASNLRFVTLYNQELEKQITERTADLSEANRKLQQLSEIDELTGIANRRKFDIELDMEWRRAIREKQYLALLMLDIDHFKGYNDQHGHQEGDRCLQLVAEVLRTLMQRAGDLVARYGGEEFVAVLPGLTAESATEVAEKIRLAVEHMRMPHPGNMPAAIVTISIGVAAMIPDQDARPSSLLHQADANLYQAKREGRNRVVTN